MKKISIALALMLALTLTACSDPAGTNTPQSTTEAPYAGNEGTPENSADNTGEAEETSAGDPGNNDNNDEWGDWGIDPFDPAVNIEFESTEDYVEYLRQLDDPGSEVLSVDELNAFLDENYGKASAIASFCKGIGPDHLDIGVDYNNSVGILADDGSTYECAATDLNSKDEFWAKASEYFSAATVEQLKKETPDYMLYENKGILYVATGAKGNYYYYDGNTIEIVQQSEDRITLSIVRSFISGEERVALRDLVKEDGKWKFDFIM